MRLRRTKEVANMLRGSSQVHGELTQVNLSHIHRVLCTEFHEFANSRALEADRNANGVEHHSDVSLLSSNVA